VALFAAATKNGSHSTAFEAVMLGMIGKKEFGKKNEPENYSLKKCKKMYFTKLIV
jgi:hypothetical protein